jgi:hypothetical protein|tara:strand:+ start:88 stop:1062 length:975 start_codon:yes stop_codon:yes gene_type:complete
MTKPTLLISFGCGWAATSPLAYTLQRYVKYCHTGFTKELKLLPLLGISPEEKVYGELQHRLERIKQRVVSNTWENYNIDIGHKMNLPEDLEPLKDFPLKLFDECTSPPYTVDNYIKYYYNVWEHVKRYGYKAVADHSKIHPMNLESFVPILEKLHEHFNLKSYIIVRDPVRRAFSEYLKACYLMNLPAEQASRYKYRANTSDPRRNGVDYITYFDRIKQIIPDSHMIVMEELWEGSGREKEKLSKFIDTPIQKLWNNSYAPDRGHLIERDPTAPCQFGGQSSQELTPQMYYDLKQSFQSHYDNWQKRYGILPRYWGRPLNYAKT